MSKKSLGRLTNLLIISGALNIALLATFVYSVLKDREAPVAIELVPKTQTSLPGALSNEKVLHAYSLLTFADLLPRLENKELVEDGFSKRDLALACLVSFHHFNLERALGGLELQRRYVPFSNAQGEQIPVAIFSGLQDFHYQAITHYARTEKWPFTPQGLFFEIQRSASPREPTLLEAFSLTPHYHTVMLLMTRTGLKLEREVLVEMLAQGDWNVLNTFTEEQRHAQDLSLDRRRTFLLSYLNLRSPLAARIFLEADLEFALKRLGDAQILALFELTPSTSSPHLLQFAKELIVSPRCDAIWKRSAALLYTHAGEPLLEPYDHLRTLKRFASEMFAGSQPPQPAAQEDSTKTVQSKSSRRTHTVAQGESLWKIARKYNVSVESLKRLNRLDTDRVRPGKKLEIPEK